MKKETATLIRFILAPVLLLLCGFTTCTLWQWFVVETFGIKAITIAQAIGIDFLITFIVTTNIPKKSEDKSVEEFTHETIYPFAFTLTTLFFGWIVHLFI